MMSKGKSNLKGKKSSKGAAIPSTPLLDPPLNYSASAEKGSFLMYSKSKRFVYSILSSSIASLLSPFL